MLASYLTNTQNLLQNPTAPASLYSTASLTTWINIARGQVAGDSEGCRFLGTLNTAIGQRAYNFSSISLGSGNGLQGVIHVRSILFGVGQGYQKVNNQTWEWFLQYSLNNPVPVNGPPSQWAQFGQGSAGLGSITGEGSGSMSSGSFYIDPPPDTVYQLTMDCVCYPAALVLDTDFEALPYLWTDAVPYFAAYLALLSAQTGARQADAARMFNSYQTFVQRARQFSTPAVNRTQYEQVGDPVSMNKMGMKPSGGGG